MKRFTAFILGIGGLAVVTTVMYLGANQVFLRTAAPPAQIACRANFYYGGNWCAPCNAVKVALNFYVTGTQTINYAGINTRFKGYLQIKDWDALPEEVQENIPTVPQLDLFNVGGTYIGRLTDKAQVIAKLQELEINVNDPIKCPFPVVTPSYPPPPPLPEPAPTSSVSPMPTYTPVVTVTPVITPYTTFFPTPTPTPTITPFATFFPTPTPTPTITPFTTFFPTPYITPTYTPYPTYVVGTFGQQVAARGISSPITDAISSGIYLTFHWMWSGVLSIADMIR
ncbi:MAG: hypothetical protein A3E36_03885 [Candidatus Andersenbacteria bacterium RIFCSPHIGHO2_12_FULL_45_11b]|uniref:Uncharacterized protein n=1 Tax=Candidatus Andersenbacteria bacterium RIFCSPHIGHO2_12_FULL_45_11b TaxID=1797282 RepID=A0A1G1X9F2_9BACT|nr:MAG: hypothetical protein A3E36_03885 [Candidatus Andersenbacteria bacterium RIFCSPHIGHO2_12_FULL_45_11b]